MTEKQEISRVQVLIRRFLFEVDEILTSAEACQKWLTSFAKTLQFQDLAKEPNNYALALLKEAKNYNDQQRKNSQIKQVRKLLKDEGISNPTKKEILERWEEVFGDAPTREDGENIDNGGITTASAKLESGTSPTNMPRVGQNEAHPRIQGGGRPAQGSMSLSPEEAAQSGNLYGVADTREDLERDNKCGNTSALSRRLDQLQHIQGSAKSQGSAKPCGRGDRATTHAPTTSPSARRLPMPLDKQAVLDFAADNGLDVDDAYECWHVTVNERRGLTADGKRINNWKAYVTQWCHTRKEKRGKA